MKKLFFAILFALPFLSRAQTPISSMPLFAGSPTEVYVPAIVKVGSTFVNRRLNVNYFGFRGLDSNSVSAGTTYDTIHVWKYNTSGVRVKAYYMLTRASGGSGGSGTVGSVTASGFTGLSVNVSNPTTSPAIAITTNLSGILLGNGTGFAALPYGANGTSLTMVGGVPTFTSTPVNFGPGLDYSNNVLDLAENSIKMVADANYVITASDAYLLLPNPGATRTLTLPAASTLQKKRIIIDCRADASGEWVLSGSFVQSAKDGTSLTEDFVNAGFPAHAQYYLVSCFDNTAGVWRWFSLKFTL